MKPDFILYVAASLDGYIARLDGSIDWLEASGQADEGASESQADTGYEAFYETIDALIMGATTYEQVLGFGDWPYPGKLTYVVTTRDLTSDRSDVVFLKAGLDAGLEAVQKHHRVWIVGGGQLASAFIQRDLVDEYIITIMPVILGAGISLYQSLPEVRLRHHSTKELGTGVVELRYQPIR